MSWRYVYARESVLDETIWSVREFYELEDGRVAWSAKPVAPIGDSLTELHQALDRMLSGTRAEILDLDRDPPGLVEMDAEGPIPYLVIGNSEPLPEGLPDELAELLRAGRAAQGWCDHGRRIDTCPDCAQS